MPEIISLQRSVIPACDVANDIELERLVKETCDIPGIGAYKVGFQLTILYGLKHLVGIIKKYTSLPIIYDHQKAGTDIPELGENFAQVCKLSGIDAIILFPFGGAATEDAWIKACREEGLGVIVGGHMTQRQFLDSEGGFIANGAPKRIYEIAAENSVTDFVVPGNKPEIVMMYRKLLEGLGIRFTLYAPGFLAQGGEISETGKVAGENWHAIVGKGIYKAKDIRSAAIEFTNKLL